MPKQPPLYSNQSANGPAVALAALQELTIADDPVLLVFRRPLHQDSQSFRKAMESEPISRQGEPNHVWYHSQVSGDGLWLHKEGREGLSDHPEVEDVRLSNSVEKPNLETARISRFRRLFLEQRDVHVRASQISKELSRFTPQIVDTCRAALDKGSRTRFSAHRCRNVSTPV
jgi:hypothetical protein